jgi:hypothetical protein
MALLAPGTWGQLRSHRATRRRCYLSQLNCPHMPLRWINQTLMPPVGRRHLGGAPARLELHPRRTTRLSSSPPTMALGRMPGPTPELIHSAAKRVRRSRLAGAFPATCGRRARFRPGLVLHEMMSHRVPRPPLVSTHAYFFAPGGSKAPLLKMSEDLECADSSSFLKKFSAVNRSSPAEQAS